MVPEPDIQTNIRAPVGAMERIVVVPTRQITDAGHHETGAIRRKRKMAGKLALPSQ